MKQKEYLVEYKMILAGGMVQEGIEKTWAHTDEEAQSKVDTWLRIGQRNAEIHIGESVAV